MKKNIFPHTKVINMSYLIACLILICCFGCNGHPTTHKRDAETSLVIDLEKALPVSDVLEKTGTIYLEHKEDTFPGFVSRMHIQNDTLYLLDTFKARGLYAYGPKGDLLFAYTRVGQGENEFINPSDFQIYGDFVYLLDAAGNKIIKLSKRGDAALFTKLTCHAFAFALDSKGGVLLDKGNTAVEPEAYTLLYQRNGKTQTFIPIPEELRNLTIAPYFTLINVGDAIHFLPEMQNRIYSYENDTVKETYYLDFGNHWCTPDFLKSNRHTDFRHLFRKMDENEYITELNYLESDSLLSLSFKCNNQAYLFFYDKANGRQLLSTAGKPTDDSYRPMAIDGNEIYFTEMTDSDNRVNKYRLNFGHVR